jgi:hypothetical protein
VRACTDRYRRASVAEHLYLKLDHDTEEARRLAGGWMNDPGVKKQVDAHFKANGFDTELVSAADFVFRIDRS